MQNIRLEITDSDMYNMQNVYNMQNIRLTIAEIGKQTIQNVQNMQNIRLTIADINMRESRRNAIPGQMLQE